MNFLAHLCLSDGTDGSLLGALCGDFLYGHRVTDFPREIQQGIRLHQFIDTFTDEHPVFRQSKRRIQSERRRYAGVLIDIFYDHFLAIAWADYSSEPLGDFTQKVYRLLEINFEQLPNRLKRVTSTLIQEDWLMEYGTDQGLERTFARLSQRIKREHPIAQSVQDLQLNRVLLSQDFDQFFPALQGAVEAFSLSLES